MKNLFLVFLLSFTSCFNVKKDIYFSNDGLSYSVNSYTKLSNIRNDGKKDIYARLMFLQKRKDVDGLRHFFGEIDSTTFKTVIIKPNVNLFCNHIVEVYEGFDACGHKLVYDFQYVGSLENEIFYKSTSYTP